MKQYYILCIDDEIDVLDAVVRDLGNLEDTFPIETAENAKEARKVIQRITSDGDAVAVVFCDHVMPGENGVDFLVSIHGSNECAKTRKILLTGQAGLEATVQAVNCAQLNHYIAKPWKAQELVDVARKQITDYLIETGERLTSYLRELDAEKIAEAARLGKLEDF